MAALPQFQNLLKLAERALGEAGHGDRADELLEPARALLVDNRDFWRNQSDGLAVYAAPGLLRVFRLPIELPDEVAVGDAPRLRPLAMLLAQTNSFYVLALSPNAVRLFEATQSTIGELDLGEGRVCHRRLPFRHSAASHAAKRSRSWVSCSAQNTGSTVRAFFMLSGAVGRCGAMAGLPAAAKPSTSACADRRGGP